MRQALIGRGGSAPYAIAIAGSAIALIGGAILALINPIIGALLIVSILGLALATKKEWLLYFTLIIALLVSGLAQLYFPPLSFVRWLVPVTSGLLILYVVAALINSKQPAASSPWIIRWAALFLLVGVFTTLLNWSGAFGFVQGIKLYFQLWGLFFAVVLVAWRPAFLDTVLKVLLVLALIQLPFVLHQFFFIVPEREGLWHLGIVPVDVVSGTMGADRFGSGKNSVMSFFLVSVFGVLLSLWREKAIKSWLLIVTAPLLLAALFINESKFALVLFLVVSGYVFRKDIYQRPLRFVLILLATVLVTTGLLISYSLSFGKGASIGETIELTIESNIGSSGYAGQVLNRWTAITFWADKHGFEDIPGTLIGHGLGASHETKQSALSVGTSKLTDTLYRDYGIGLTSISSILWDTGLIGLFTVIAIFISAFFASGSLSRLYATDPWYKGVFAGLQAAILIAVLMLFHSNYFVLDPSFQSLIYFMLGYIGYWSVRSVSTQLPAQAL